MATTMQAAVMDRAGTMTLREVPVPAISGDEVLVKVEACGVCGTDYHIFTGHVPSVSFPIIAGHEAVGVVVATAPDADPTLVGRRCVVEGKAGTGFTRDGAYAEYLTVPQSQVTPLPASIDPVTGTLLDPLACAIHAVHRAEPADGARIVVVGQGSSGLCVTMALRALTGARVCAVDLDDARLALSRQYGAEIVLNAGRDDVAARVRAWTGGELADGVIEVTGKPGGAQLALGLVRFGGRLTVYGVFDDPVPFDLTSVTLNEIEIRGAVGSPGTYPLALELAESGRVDLRPIVSRYVTLADLPALFGPGGSGASERKSVLTY